MRSPCFRERMRKRENAKFVYLFDINDINPPSAFRHTPCLYLKRGKRTAGPKIILYGLGGPQLIFVEFFETLNLMGGRPDHG